MLSHRLDTFFSYPSPATVIEKKKSGKELWENDHCLQSLMEWHYYLWLDLRFTHSFHVK